VSVGIQNNLPQQQASTAASTLAGNDYNNRLTLILFDCTRIKRNMSRLVYLATPAPAHQPAFERQLHEWEISGITQSALIKG
jgi:hypothetical protein